MASGSMTRDNDGDDADHGACSIRRARYVRDAGVLQGMPAPGGRRPRCDRRCWPWPRRRAATVVCCSQCSTDRTDFVVTSRDVVKPW